MMGEACLAGYSSLGECPHYQTDGCDCGPRRPNMASINCLCGLKLRFAADWADFALPEYDEIECPKCRRLWPVMAAA